MYRFFKLFFIKKKKKQEQISTLKKEHQQNSKFLSEANASLHTQIESLNSAKDELLVKTEDVLKQLENSKRRQSKILEDHKEEILKIQDSHDQYCRGKEEEHEKVLKETKELHEKDIQVRENDFIELCNNKEKMQQLMLEEKAKLQEEHESVLKQKEVTKYKKKRLLCFQNQTVVKLSFRFNCNFLRFCKYLIYHFSEICFFNFSFFSKQTQKGIGGFDH